MGTNTKEGIMRNILKHSTFLFLVIAMQAMMIMPLSAWHHEHERVYVEHPWHHPNHVVVYEGAAYPRYYAGYPYYYYSPQYYYNPAPVAVVPVVAPAPAAGVSLNVNL